MRRTPPLLIIAFLVLATLLLRHPAGVGADVDVPDYPHGSFEGECTDCHSPEGWTPAVIGPAFDHARYGFPLEGAHAASDCRTCHQSLAFADMPTQCASCHQDVHEGELGLDCASCHTARSFGDHALLDVRHQISRLPLTGAHALLDCESCHLKSGESRPDFANQDPACASCHLGAYETTEQPPHAAAHLSTECRLCHGTTAWSDGQFTPAGLAGFDHGVTGFPLTGKHAAEDCASCHGGGVYAGLATDCASCHQADFDATTEPDHVAAAFSTDCASCHGTQAWDEATFDHDTATRFPLTGAHAQQECISCHGGGVYAELATDCASCHLAEFQATTEPNHVEAGYPLACETCHGTAAWDEATFDHAASDFPLTGAHATAECASCHGGGQYDGLAVECAACHQASFDATTNPNHLAAGFSNECATCHSTIEWPGAAFDHNTLTTFALTGAHVQQDCASCHGGGQYAGLAADCASCHLSDYNGVVDPPHAALGYPLDCQKCHGTSSFDGADFDHNQRTQFPLTGAHIGQECRSCHGDGIYEGRSTECASCHQASYDATTNPNHLAAGFPNECATCHSTTDWNGATFDHNTQTQFALTGAHVQQDCASCHGGGVYNGLATDCASCHLSDYNGTTDPNHAALGYPTDCRQCHGTAAWDDADFDHDLTQFPLTGAHVQQDCASCHGGGVYAGLAVECASCHQAVYDATTDPNHLAAGFPNECATCHSTTDWNGATFDHNTQTQFALTGAHVQQDCASCHGGGVYNGLATDCASCHLSDYNGTTDPNHAALGYPTDCQQCHGTAAWDDADFDHDLTQFPLTGAHVQQDCASCHGGSVYAGLAVECASCHQASYDATTDPNHLAAGFPNECATCHSTINWTGATFDHNTQTQFALTGAHVQQDCASCHGGGVYNGLATDCASCHLSDYNGTTDPNHAQAGYPTACQNCHGTASWDDGEFDHNVQTSFALTGAHVQQDCVSCHGGGVYDGLATDCASCHQTVYDATTDPPHVEAGFPNACATCHSTIDWADATFDHNTQTSFPLTGAHVQQDCASCHGGGVYDGLATDCASCHLSDYNATSDPNHAQAGYPTACENCHGTATWDDGEFDHNSQTSFALTGAHVEEPCASCHGGGVYDGLAVDCASCHLTQFNGTTDPNHAQAGFSLACETCHTTIEWPGASFNHAATGFALTGAHTRTDCASCHGGGVYNGLATDCASCHLADYQGTTDPNHAQAGYPLECQNCHGTNSFEGADFNHNTRTSFPLTGAHVQQDCVSCHGGGVFAGLSTQCAACHQGVYDATTAPNHIDAGFPNQCESCHTTIQWEGATFDHAQTDFPLTGAHTQEPCASCHGGGVYNGLATDCASCHLSDYNATTDPNHVQAGFSTQCQTCHTTIQWPGATFDHNQTGFPLTGAHTQEPCASCHGGGVYNGLATDCASCHLSDYNATTDPNHAQAGYPTDCQQCHGTSSFAGADFDHNTRTSFPLTGAHVQQDCVSCHGGGIWDGLSTQCAACHLADFNGTTDPNHVQAGFSTQCQTCHTTIQWPGATFDHNQTGFPLTGAHTQEPCASCHGGGVYNGLATDCASCHLDDYNGTTDPNHAQAGYPTACQECHGTSSFAGADFDHNARTSFPLTGAHVPLDCVSCHGGGIFDGLGTDCADCHLDDYNGTTDPNHAQASFPLACATCHTTIQWPGATFDHDLSGFPLTGAHLAVECAGCHGGGVYNGLSTRCEDCHLADYNGTTDPNHASAGFPLDCATCHTTIQWPGATFDHNLSDFPLTGAHPTLDCASCHGGGVYDGLSTQCADCHLADYNGTSDPNHAAAGFPLACASCHTTIRWSGATFDHDSRWFPIYSGKHRDKWDQCADCHTSPTNFTTFTCLSCHPHSDKNKTDRDHQGRNGYQYSSPACYNCHPRGRSD